MSNVTELKPTPRNLYEQLSNGERNGLAILLGFSQEGAGFRSNLRDIPAFRNQFTLGDAAVAYATFIITGTTKRKERRMGNA